MLGNNRASSLIYISSHNVVRLLCLWLPSPGVKNANIRPNSEGSSNNITKSEIWFGVLSLKSFQRVSSFLLKTTPRSSSEPEAVRCMIVALLVRDGKIELYILGLEYLIIQYNPLDWIIPLLQYFFTKFRQGVLANRSSEQE
jgi:hypothetical protein